MSVPWVLIAVVVVLQLIGGCSGISGVSLLVSSYDGDQVYAGEGIYSFFILLDPCHFITPHKSIISHIP